MSADIPHTLYLKNNGDGSPSFHSSYSLEESRRRTDDAMRKNEEAARRMQERMRPKAVSITEILNKGKLE